MLRYNMEPYYFTIIWLVVKLFLGLTDKFSRGRFFLRTAS